jgi:hypothetical protein
LPKVVDNFRDQIAGWKLLQNKVLKGDNLNPHLSKTDASLKNKDGLLAGWGVHHFHLGKTPDPKDSFYVKRTPPLVYALVDDRVFCAINVYPHGEWEDFSILENAPHLFAA